MTNEPSEIKIRNLAVLTGSKPVYKTDVTQLRFYSALYWLYLYRIFKFWSFKLED